MANFIVNLQVICLFDCERPIADHPDQSHRYNTSQQERVSWRIWRGTCQAMLLLVRIWTFFIIKLVCKLLRVLLCSLVIFTQEGIEAEKQTISLLSKLRNELQTDKPILALTDGRQDAESWNQYLQRHQAQEVDQGFVSWFKSPWLYVECYMYRRIQEAVWLKWERLVLKKENFLLLLNFLPLCTYIVQYKKWKSIIIVILYSDNITYDIVRQFSSGFPFYKIILENNLADMCIEYVIKQQLVILYHNDNAFD